MSELHGAELIAAVRDVLHENGWRKNAFCDTEMMRQAIVPQIRVCVRGAARWAQAGGLWRSESEDSCRVDLELCSMLAPVIREQYADRIPLGHFRNDHFGVNVVAAFNDHGETTWDELMGVLDKAEVQAREREGL